MPLYETRLYDKMAQAATPSQLSSLVDSIEAALIQRAGVFATNPCNTLIIDSFPEYWAPTPKEKLDSLDEELRAEYEKTHRVKYASPWAKQRAVLKRGKY